MKKIKPVTLLVLFFLFFWSGKQKSILQIDPGKFVSTDFALSTIASDVIYIPLSSEVPMRTVSSIAFSDSLIFINDRSSEGLLIFNKMGTFKYRIGKKGRGPGEYSSGITFSIDRKAHIVYILDKIDRKKVLAYTFSGKYLYEFPNDKLGGNFQEINVIEGEIYLFEFFVGGNAKYNWIVLDKKGNVLRYKSNSVIPFKTMVTIMINPVFEFDGKVCYWNQYNDTIFQIKNGKNSVRYLFADSKFRVPKDNSMDLSSYFLFRQIIETSDYLFLRTFDFSKYEIAVINKRTGASVAPGMGASSKDIQPGILNDFDGGLRFDPKKLIEMKGQKFLVTWYDAYQLKAYVASDSFMSSKPKFPEKKKALEKLASGLSENDNPVLMLVKLKE